MVTKNLFLFGYVHPLPGWDSIFTIVKEKFTWAFSYTRTQQEIFEGIDSRFLFVEVILQKK
jgi:hypothetical protein